VRLSPVGGVWRWSRRAARHRQSEGRWIRTVGLLTAWTYQSHNCLWGNPCWDIRIKVKSRYKCGVTPQNAAYAAFPFWGQFWKRPACVRVRGFVVIGIPPEKISNRGCQCLAEQIGVAALSSTHGRRCSAHQPSASASRIVASPSSTTREAQAGIMLGHSQRPPIGDSAPGGPEEAGRVEGRLAGTIPPVSPAPWRVYRHASGRPPCTRFHQTIRLSVSLKATIILSALR